MLGSIYDDISGNLVRLKEHADIIKLLINELRA